jgi:hypothetical protein
MFVFNEDVVDITAITLEIYCDIKKTKNSTKPVAKITYS